VLEGGRGLQGSRGRAAALTAGLGVAIALLAGCGGDSGPDVPPTTPEDRQGLERVTDEIVAAARTRDIQAFCDIVQPSLVDEAFGGRKGCLRIARASMVPESPLARLEIEDVVTDGQGAIVTFAQNPPGDVLFVKEEGRWFIALNELAEARQDAANGGSGTGEGGNGPDSGGTGPDSGAQG
jgi:hypothetical protein